MYLLFGQKSEIYKQGSRQVLRNINSYFYCMVECAVRHQSKSCLGQRTSQILNSHAFSLTTVIFALS